MVELFFSRRSDRGDAGVAGIQKNCIEFTHLRDDPSDPALQTGEVRRIQAKSDSLLAERRLARA
ncbi:hypothetical protein WS63_17555 [Burkholderia stagnalis]|nr:hypothetical protein WS63_17555 [Burkholderia stagnalis]KWK47717.1 hypothetical protein WT80_19425 [Burkholderia stagnalis]KWK56442.1 hypothetical protein WT81_20665 [Burkholderia stagnalis]KWN67732.1 hypothetical protein WT90_27755 [Burkholderia stagnalis]